MEKLFHYHNRIFFETGLTNTKFGKVLDIGCGVGNEAEIFASWGNQVTGIDISKFKEWEKPPEGVNFEKGNGENLKFKDHSFDMVFAKDVLHHTKNPKKMLLEAKRVCKRSGRVVFVEPNRGNPISYLHMTCSLGHNHLSQKKFKQMVKEVFPKSQIGAFEAHFYPFLKGSCLKSLHTFEKAISKVLFFYPWLSYNFFSYEN